MVRSELQAIVDSQYFRSSKRYPAFLSYIVEKTLKGEASELKERTIGVDVFGRPHDYDTNSDPIVRNAASEVRRRLSLYEAKAPASRHVHILLPPGCYLPQLQFVAEDAQTPRAQDHEHPQHNEAEWVEEHPEKAAALHPASRLLHAVRHFGWIAATLLVLLSCGLGWVLWGLQDSSADKLWTGFLNQPDTVLIVVPHAPAFLKSTPDKSILADWLKGTQNIAVEDSRAMMDVQTPLMNHRVSFRVAVDTDVTLEDLRNRPVVLIGGPSNAWTARLLPLLRFHFNTDFNEGGVGLRVVDAQNPAARQWGYFVNNDGPHPTVVEDCAIIARYHDPATGGIVMVIAGAGRNGTEAAGAFVDSKTLLDDLNRQLPSGWKNRNLEIVLKASVIDGKTGSPSIVATHVW